MNDLNLQRRKLHSIPKMQVAQGVKKVRDVFKLRPSNTNTG